MPVWREEMAKKKVGAYITLDGEKEFRSAVTQCNKSLSTMKSEMKLVEAETAGNANSVDTLRKKNEVLTRTLDKQVEKEEAVRKGLTHAQEDYARVGTELQEYRTKLEQAQSTLDEMKQSSDVSEEALSRQQEAVSELTEKVEKGEATYQRAGNRVEDWQKQLNNAQAQTIKATRAVNENTAYLEEAEKATDGCAKSIDKFGKQTDDVAEKITSTGKIIKANLINTMVDAGKSLATNVFKDAVQGTLELQDAQQKLQASTGATARETAAYSQEMQNLYKGGYGDAIDEAASAMALVKQYTNETDPTKIKELAENGMALEDVFGMDLSESIRGADALVTNMGIDGKTAFDLMAKGAQNGLNKSGELADNLTEYSSLWAQAGFSAEEMFAILENGLNSGAYNLDKVNDYVKEFGNSLADGRIDDHIKSFSAGTQDLVKKWHDGSATTKEVFQSVISDLASMKNEQEALTLASDTWSALGEDNAMKVITSLNNVNNSYKNVQGTMEKVKDIKYDSITNQWKVLGRTVQADVVQPLLVKYLPMAQKGIKLVADNLETIVPVAELAGTAIGGIFVVNKSKKFISEVKDAGVSLVDFGKKAAELIGIRTAATTAEAASTVAQEAQAAATATQTAATVAQTAATEGATVAQAGFNAVLAANPAILVVAGVTALIGVTAVLASKMGDATSETDELIQSTSELKDKASETSEALKQATQNMTSSMEEVNASGTLANNLTDELVKLAGQSNQTTEQQSRMKTIVMELNTMFPEMSLAIDETTGKLSMSSEEMKNYIKSALEMQKIQVAQEKMKDSVEKLVDAEVEKADAENKVSEIGEKLAAIEAKRSEVNDVLREKTEATKEAQEKYSEVLKKGADNVDELYAATQDQSEATIEYNGNIVTVTEALRQMADDERELNDAKQTAKDSQKEINDAIKEANAEMEPYMSYLSDMTEETNNNTAATKNNTSAKTEATEQSSVSITMAGQELEAYQNLSVSQQELAVNVTNSVLTMQENVQSALKSQMDMFEEFDAGTQISTENLLANMQSQVDGVTAWEQNLSALADRGINQGILQKLSEMGPQGSGYVAAFNSMTDEELKKANDLWSQSVDIQGMTNEWGQQLLTSGAANIAGGMDGLTSVMQESGTNTVMGLVQGMQNAQEKANAAGKDLGVKTVEAVNNGLGCQSPSKKTRESGKNVDLGLVQGMKNGESNVKTEARSVASGAINVFAAQCTASKTQLYGYNLSIGLANGISDGRSAVISAASRVASDAIATAKKKLEINSPSKVFWRMGQYSMQGLANGVTENSLLAQNAVKEAVDYSGTSMTFGNMAENEYTQYKALRNIIKDAVKDLQIRAYLGEREVTRTLSDWGVVFNA